METVTEVNINQGSPTTENKMTDEKLNKLAKLAVEDIHRATGRLDEIQDACRHKEEQTELIQGVVKQVCSICLKVVGFSSQEQSKNAGYVS